MEDYYQKHLNRNINEEEATNLNNRKSWKKRLIKSLNISDIEYYFLKEDFAHEKPIPFDKFKIKPGLRQNFHSHSTSSFSHLDTLDVEDGPNILNIPENGVQNGTILPSGPLSDFQEEMASIIFSYRDIFYPQRTPEDGTLLRNLYCLHILNHAHATRQTIISNNTQLENGDRRGNRYKGVKPYQQDAKNSHPGPLSMDNDSSYRDRGFTRPKTLIVVPFRNSAFRIVQTLIALTSNAANNNKLVTNKRRFYQEFQDPDGDANVKFHSEDRRELFSGNVDDCFKIGIGIGKKSLKLYTDFYGSDIIICSPLGLKTLGVATKKVVSSKHQSDLTNGRLSEADIKEKEVVDESLDFLSSIEILVLDQADVFLMQNWSHVDYLMKMINNRPIKAHDTDFSRVREWYLNGWARHYRQTLIFSRVNCPQLNQLFHSYCLNFEGKALMYQPPSQGTLDGISTSLTHTFLRIEPVSKDAIESISNRFTFFTDKIMKQVAENRKLGRRTFVFVPSYFDFVRIRNYLMDLEIPFLSVTEYDEEKHIKRVRRAIHAAEVERRHSLSDDEDQDGNPVVRGEGRARVDERTLLVVGTERSHFFRRPRVPHVHALVFYQLPTYPAYYDDLCADAGPDPGFDATRHVTSTVAYDPTYDWFRLLPLLGPARCAALLAPSEVTRNPEPRIKRPKTIRAPNEAAGSAVFITGASKTTSHCEAVS